MNNSINNDLIKIKEDAIKIQEQDLRDTITSIDNETTKSSLVIGFAGILFGIAFGQIDNFPLFHTIIFISLLLASIAFAFWNMISKKITIHTNVDSIFVNKRPQEWEEYLNYRHLHLRDTYNNAKNLLYQKATFTKISFCLLILSSLFLILIKIGG